MSENPDGPSGAEPGASRCFRIGSSTSAEPSGNCWEPRACSREWKWFGVVKAKSRSDRLVLG